MNTAVLAISDQTVQNVQFVKEFAGQIQQYWFITTEKMEKKGSSSWINKALKLCEEQIQKIVVNEFDIPSIETKLQEYYHQDDTYFVNITGGTKLMSLAINDFFKTKPNATIYYLTGEDNQMLNLSQNQKMPLKSAISLEEYLTSYGIVIMKTSQMKPSYNFELSEKIYEEFVKGDEKNIDLLQKLRDHIQSKENKKKKSFMVSAIEGLRDFLETIRFRCEQDEISVEDAKYLTGRWLEEYTYYHVKEKLQLSDDCIATGLYLQKKDIEKTDNDFDLMFMFKNKLHIIECKTSHRVNKENKLTEYIYKLDALQKEFGLFPKSFIFTLGKLPSDEEKNQQAQISDRLKFHKIDLLTKEKSSIQNTAAFMDWLADLSKRG